MKVFPNGRCYCGCGEELGDRTAFWVRGHDARAAHRVISDNYGTVADFVVAHDSEQLAELKEKVSRLEQLVFPEGREAGPLASHLRTPKQWHEMRDVAGDVSRLGVPASCPGGWSVLYLATGLLDAHASNSSR